MLQSKIYSKTVFFSYFFVKLWTLFSSMNNETYEILSRRIS